MQNENMAEENDMELLAHQEDDDNSSTYDEDEFMEDYPYEPEEEEEEDGIKLLLDAPHPHLDATMALTEEQHGWACQLKSHLLERRDDTDVSTDWTDMELAHFALIAQGNLNNALQRLRGMQAFRETHGVDHSSIRQGVLAIERFMQQQTGLLLCIDVDPLTWEGLRVVDVGALNPAAALESESSWRDFILGDYYLYYSCQPTLKTVQEGCFCMMDFGGFGWRHWNIELQYRFCEEMFVHYPIRFRKLLCFNTGSVANLCWSLVRRVYPSSTIKVLQLGCKVPLEENQDFPSALREKYLQPNLRETYQRQLVRVKDLLSLRAKNESLFRL